MAEGSLPEFSLGQLIECAMEHKTGVFGQGVSLFKVSDDELAEAIGLYIDLCYMNGEG
ncbi:MAG: hypothetical protein ACXABY_01340 [Candidatus Thorarchaeota archaeon]